MSVPRRNIELKARVADLDAARVVAREVATEAIGVEKQVDTYFGCRSGRLKLREREGLTAQLIAYQRSNGAESRPSDYRLVDVTDPGPLKDALAMALGVETVVSKDREIFLHENVRIHLDNVQGQGAFIEFEAVLGPRSSEAEGYARIASLALRFGIDAANLVKGSYGAENAAPNG